MKTSDQQLAIEPGATIAVVGASARAAAFSLLRSGYHVMAADLFADTDLSRQCRAERVTPYPDDLVDWLANTECDAWLYTGALENYPALVNRLSVTQPLLGHNGLPLRRVRDPIELQSVLPGAGLDFPETLRTAKSPTNGTWLGKTYAGSCGSGVGNTASAKYWQRRVAGTPMSAVFRGDRLLGVTRQLVGETWAGAAEFQYCGTIAPWTISAAYDEQLQQLGVLMLNEFGMTDLYGVDLIDDGKRLWTLEVNPRYTAAVEVVERAYGISVFDESIQTLTQHCCGKVVLFAKESLVISEALSSQLLLQAGEIAWPSLADIPAAGTEVSIGQPILTLFAEEDSCEAVEGRLRQRASEIEQQIYQGTTPCV